MTLNISAHSTMAGRLESSMAAWKPSQASRGYTHGYKRKASASVGGRAKRPKLAASEQSFQIITDSLAPDLHQELQRQFQYATDDHVLFVAADRKITLPNIKYRWRAHLFEQIQRRRFDGRVVTSGGGFRAHARHAKVEFKTVMVLAAPALFASDNPMSKLSANAALVCHTSQFLLVWEVAALANTSRGFNQHCSMRTKTPSLAPSRCLAQREHLDLTSLNTESLDAPINIKGILSSFDKAPKRIHVDLDKMSVWTPLFCGALDSNLRGLQELVIIAGDDVPLFRVIFVLPKLERLSLTLRGAKLWFHDDRTIAADMECLPSSPSLTHLDVESTFPETTAALIAKCPSLTRLVLSIHALDRGVMNAIAKTCRHLQDIYIRVRCSARLAFTHPTPCLVVHGQCIVGL